MYRLDTNLLAVPGEQAKSCDCVGTNVHLRVWVVQVGQEALYVLDLLSYRITFCHETPCTG